MKTVRKKQQQHKSPERIEQSPFAKLLAKYSSISTDARQFLEKYTYIKKVYRNQTLTPAGEISQSIYYVHSGALLLHQKNHKRAVNTALFFQGSIAPHPIDFFFELPAQQDLKAACTSLVYVMDLSHARLFFRYYPQPILSLQYLLLQSRLSFTEKEQLQQLTTKEKLRHFLQIHPDAPRLLQSKAIAAYLGVQAETLSRAKNKSPRNQQTLKSS
ncbi:MAG: Crp/Fnr family transcriptional regulator [Pseudobacter sp.]|uniref:Crp/Fnr family transcriptional regulator n=1 Tax=Pseudobacter sp. TaxID=2045420 RepID=UPI003F7D9A64